MTHCKPWFWFLALLSIPACTTDPAPGEEVAVPLVEMREQLAAEPDPGERMQVRRTALEGLEQLAAAHPERREELWRARAEIAGDPQFHHDSQAVLLAAPAYRPTPGDLEVANAYVAATAGGGR